MSLFRRAIAAAARHKLPLFLVLIWSYFLQWHPAYPNPNEVVRLYLTRAIVDDGTFAIDGQMRRFGDVEDKSQHKGRFHNDKAVGLSFLAVPIYLVLKLFDKDPPMATLRHATWLALVILPSLFLLFALRRTLRRHLAMSPIWGDALLTTYALGTLAFTFSTLVFGHQPTAVFLFLAFFVVTQIRAGERTPRAALLAGALGGIAVMLEYTSFPPFVIIFALATVRRNIWLYALGAAPAFALIMIHNAIAFDSPFTTGYSRLAVESFRAVHATGLIGVSTPKWEAFAGSFFEPARGLFFYSPFLLLAIPGFVLLFRRREMRAEGIVCTAIFIFYAYFISSFGYWQSGGSVGPRHLTPLVPFLIVPVAATLRWIATRAVPALRAALAAPVFALFAIGILTVVLTSIPWPYPAFGFTNPLTQVGLLFWRQGYLPPSLGTAVGLDQGTAAFLFFVLLAIALAIVLHALRENLTTRTGLAAGVAAAAIGILGFAAYTNLNPRPEETAARTNHALASIVRLVDKDRAGYRSPDARRANANLARGPDSASEQLVGEVHAQNGQWQEALKRYLRAAQTAAVR
ncbi:MAG: hypothetical protein HYY84_14425 [Deltaproteobacteria bacterium]|nr:hypothetical protein [Deltaproteobacteria bacterium]